ncbi:hypothetical protein EDL99_09830 [Ornithobacterium rhinotracheale]|uniref:hypothetical protein n=1 Tax=Ornithobacterium rhinotracheale TaxID=28251 RepID=UPI00129C4F0A|nr:hypothetical protein [Ornithobacterium rhinotracheale]MRJ09155.1 hypothetical protein [Ornithobacterium rhinotracheale]UOH77260.1 hypothetical protein MT996_08560 [Ornithobacterium rhinotracheale]
MQIVVLHKQSLFDVCLMHTGSIVGVFELAQANNLSITDDVQAGERLELPQPITQDADILAYYQAKNIQPATALEEYTEKLEGISYWTINQDFKVS